MSGFGPSDTVWSDQSGPEGDEITKIVVLAEIGQAELTDLQLMRAGEHTPENIPLENPAGERLGTVRNTHFSLDRQVLIAEIISGHRYRDNQLTTEFTKDRSKLIRVVLVK